MRRRHRRRLRQLIRRLHDAWYWLKCRLWHRYNVVVCRDLPPTWCDRDYLLLYAAFTIFAEFVEREKGHFDEPDVFALYSDYQGEDPDERAKVEAYARRMAVEWKTIRELYAWWQGRKGNNDFDDYYEDSAMLHRLIAVRGHLWT
jgi:hypothetical protein